MAKWTKARTEMIRTLWLDGGLSASQIARKMGVFSRNAVIGKIHRMGLSDRDRGRKSRVKIDVTLPKLEAKPVVRQARPAQWAAHQKPPEQYDTDDDLKPLVKGLMPKDRRCRWPYGDPKFPNEYATCGRRRSLLEPYCEKHEKMAFRGHK